VLGADGERLTADGLIDASGWRRVLDPVGATEGRDPSLVIGTEDHVPTALAPQADGFGFYLEKSLLRSGYGWSFAAGDHVPTGYDPMIAKLIAHGETRDEALERFWRWGERRLGGWMKEFWQAYYDYGEGMDPLNFEIDIDDPEFDPPPPPSSPPSSPSPSPSPPPPPSTPPPSPSPSPLPSPSPTSLPPSPSPAGGATASASPSGARSRCAGRSRRRPILRRAGRWSVLSGR
jgi:hypothetical protein